LLLAIEVGDRSLDMAQQLVHGVVGVLAPGVVPLFLTDQLAAYGKAVLTHFGCWVERVSEKSGRILHCWMPVEQLRYAQVKKRRRRRKIVAMTTRVVFGTKEAVQIALRAVGHRINTAFVERLNRTLRAHVPGLGRRVEGLARTKGGLRRRLMLVMGYYNLCLPHRSLRQALPSPVPTKGNGSPKKWIPRTPAMAGGITDHVWTMEEHLLFRVPPWRQGATGLKRSASSGRKTRGLSGPEDSCASQNGAPVSFRHPAREWSSAFLRLIPFGRSLEPSWFIRLVMGHYPFLLLPARGF
jgi:hypothetical protein